MKIIPDERDKVQKKTFTKWVNKHLIRARKHVTDLYEDLRDGHNLSTLLEVLSKDTLPRERGKMRFHRLQNIQIALDYLRQRQIKLVNIRSDDIADGNPKLTLGLIWTIILHFQISEVQVLGQSEDMTAKEKLLLWSQKMVNTYPGLQCGNFSTSWRDGRLFNAIIHRHRPDLVDMHMVEQQDNRQNLEQAFLIAEQELGVTRLLDPEDIDVSSPDEKSIITYVSSLYDVMPKIPDVVGGLTAEEANVKYKEYRELVSSLLMWILRQISIMEDRTFPDDLSTLKALYSNFVQFKSTEFEMKLTEKNKVEDIFRLLKAWFQSGRIHLDTGFHPDDVDLEWDKLVKAMEDRDTVLHFEIERLEMLHRIASLVGNDLTCSAQLLSKASAALQADIDLTTAGQQPKETAVISHYLSEIEVKIKKVFMDIQTLREGKHILAEEFYSRALTLHEQLTALRAEHGVLLDKAGRLQERATRETREAVARAVAEDESCLKFVHDLLKWLEDMQTRVGELDWGSDLPAVEKNMSDHKDLHRSIEEFRSSIEEAKASETKVSSSLQSEYMGILNKLELHHTKLLNSSRSRQRHLDSLYNFMLRATKELVWLNQKEEDEIGYDWSEHNTDMATKKKAYSELMQVLELKEPVLKGIQAMGEDLISDGHPAKGPIQAYSAVMNTQWNWLLQLCTSVETHLAGNSAFFKFFEDVKQNEEHLKHLQDSMWRRFGCNKSTSLIAVDNVLQACVDEKEKLMDYKSHVSELVSRSKKIVQLKQRSPDCGVRNPLPVKALCVYKQLEITLHKGEECALIDNSDPIKWTVLSSFGRKARIPSACFVIPPPNSDALDAAESMDKLYHDAIGFWHQLYGNLRCMLSWHHLQNTVASVRSWTFQEFRTLRPEEHSEVMHSLGTHYEEFVQISRDANLFGPADLGQAERDYNLCNQHYEQLLHKLKKEDADEAACQHLLAELRVISQRLESYEERMIRLIRTPLGPDAAPGVSSRIAEQQRLYSEVEGIRAGLDRTRESCTEVLVRSPTVPSQPNLRSELSVVLQKAEDIYSLSSVYLEKLKTVDLVVKYLHDAESLVKSYETRLCAEEGVPAEPERVQQYIAQIKAWHAEANEELPLFHGLQEEVRRAQALNERMLVAHGERSVDLERFQERTEQLLQRWQGVHAQVDNRVRELEALSKVMSNYRTLRTELNVWLGAAVKQQDELQTSHTHDSHMLSQQLTRQKDLILDLDKHRAKLDECQRYSTEYYTRVKDYELQLMAYWTMVEKTPPKKKLLTSSADATNEEIMELRNRHSSQLSQAQQHEKFIEETLQRVQEEEAPQKVVLARHKVQEPFVQHASTVGVLIKHHQHATNTARGISKRTQPQGYLKEDVVTHGFVTRGLMKQQAAEVYVKEKSSDGIAEEKTIKGFVKEDVGVGFIKQTVLKGVVKENVAERLAEQKTIGRVLEEGVEQLEKPKARKGMVKENIAKRLAERKAIGRVLEGAEGLAKQEAIEGLKEEETIEGLMVEDATVSFTKQEDAAELMKQKAAVKLELSALRLRSKKEMSHQTTLVVEALSQQQQTEADVAKLKGELENMAQQRVAFELELEQLRATADKATKQCEKATEEANRLRFQTEEEAQKRKEAEEELRLRKAAEEEANIAKNDALEKLEQVSKQAEEVMLNQKEAAKNVLHQEMLAETAVMEQKQAETELERGNSLHGESLNEGRAAEQKACEDLIAEVEERKKIAKEADEARKAAESELETWRHRMDDALRLKALAEDSANEKRMAQKDAERQKEAAEMEARTRAESERIALEQRRKAEEECEKMRKLAEESSELKLAAETDVLHMRTSMEEVEQQRTALSEELTLVKQDMGQALNQKNMLEDELFQVKKQVQELMQCKVLAEEEIKKNSLQQSEMTQRALDEEATKLVNTIAEVARLKDMLDEMMLKRKQAEDEAAQQKAEVEHILEEKVTAIQAERHLKEEVERALLDRESEQKELRMMAEKEAQEHQRLVAEAADQQHSAEQELALLRLQFEGDLEKQRATLNDAVCQRHTIEGEIHTLHLAVTKTANEKAKLETELQCLRVAANEAAQQKAQAEVEAQRQKQLAMEEADKKQKAEEEASRLAQAEKYSTNCYLEAMKELEDLRMKATEALKKKEEAEKEAAQQLELAKAATQKQLEAEEQARLAASQYKEGEIQQPQAEEQLYAQRLQKSAEQAQRLAEEVQLAKQKAEEQAFICQQQAQDVEVLRAKAENAAELAAQAQRDAEILRKQAEDEAQNKVQAAQEAKQQQELAKRELEKQKQLVEVTGEQKVLVEQQLEKLQVQLQNSEKQQVVVEKELEKMKDEAKLAAKQNKHLEEEHATIKIQLEELLVMKIKSQEEIQQLTETQEIEKRLLLEKEEEKVKVLAAEAEKLRADAEMSARLQKDVEEELFEQCKLAEKIMKEKTEALEKAKRAQQEVFEVHKHCEDAEKHLRTVASGHDKIEEQLRHDAEHHQKALQEEFRKRTVLQAEAQQLKNVVDELTREHLQTQAEAQKAHAEAQEVSSKLMTLQEGIAHKANVCDAGVQKDNGEKLKPEAICFDIAVTAQPEFEDKSVMVDMTQTAEMPAGGAPENVMVEAKEQEAQLESKTDSLMSVEVATQVAFEEASGAMSESEKEARLSESNLIHEAQTLRKRIEEETSKHNVEKETLMMQQNILEEQKLQLQKIFEDELKNAKALLDVETKKRRKQEEDNVHLCAQMQEALREQKRAQMDIQKKREKLLGLEQQKALKEKKEWEEEHLLLKDQLKDQELQEKRSLEKQCLELAMLQSNVGKEVEQQNDSSVQSFEIEKGEVSASTSVVKQATMTTTTTTTTTYMYSMKDTAKALEEVLITIPCGQMMGKTLTVWEVLHSSLIQESSSQNIISTYREGKTSTIKIIVIIVEIIEAGAAKTDRKKLISIRGIRHPVTLETLIQTGLLSEETAILVLKEKKTIEEVSESLKSCLQGTGTIAGVVVESTNETMDVYRAMKVGLLKPGIALELLEAQAATGFLLSPLWNERLTVEQAAQKQLIGLDIKEKLLTAEKAVAGFKDLYTGKLLGIGQVLQKRESLRDLAVRLLEAQLATGGIIDPQLSVRLPLAVAHERGLLDAKMMQILTGGSCTARCYHDPMTDEMCSYKELLLKCRFVVGLHILPIKEVPKERKLSSKSSVRKRKVLIIDPDSGKDLSIYEAYRQSIIDWNTYQELIEQESEWEEIVTSSPEEGTLSSVLIDRKSGRQFDIQEALANGTLSQRSLEQYRAGDLPVFELGAILTGKVKYPHTFPSEDNIQHLQQQPLAEHTDEIGPVAGIINVDNMEKMSVMEAMQRGLVNRSTGRRLLEAQACTGGIMDINTGQRLSTESALKADLIDTFLFDQLTVAEKAYCGFWDTETKSLIPPSQALLKDLLFPEMAMYLLQVQYITGGLVEPGKEEKKKRMSLSDFQEKGYIDVQTVQKLKDMTTYPKCLTCPKNKKYISFKEALDSSIVDPQTGLKFLEAIANGAAACIRDQTRSDSASGFSGGSGSNLPGNVPFGATEQGGHRQSRNGSSFELESWSSNTRQMRFESSQMNEKGLPETPGPSTSLTLLAEGFSRNVEAENGGVTQNATTKYNQNIDQENKTLPFLVDCSVLEGGVPSGTEHLKVFLTETPEYGQDGRLIDDGSSSFPLTHDPQGDFKVNFLGDGSMTERHNLTPGTEPFPVPNIIEYPPHSCPCAGDTLFTHSSRPNNVSIPEFSQYEHLPNNAVLQKQSFWAASATFNKLQTSSTNCPTAPRTCYKEDENISNVDNKRKTRFLGSLMEKASCSKDMDCTPNVSSNTEDGEDENFAGKKATNPFSISENLCFADFQRWQEIQTELMPQITTVECACNQVAVYFGLDKMLIGESGSGGDLVNRCLALLQTLPRVVRCSGNAKLHKCTMLYLSADLITGTKGLRAFTSKVPTSGTTLFSCLEKQIVMPLNPVKAVSFPSRSFLSPLSFWHLSAALLLCHWCDGVSAHCVTDMLTCALLVAMLLIIILPFIPACATQWILPLHCCSKCIFHRPRMYKLV